MSNVSRLLNLAREDLETAQLLLENKRYRACVFHGYPTLPRKRYPVIPGKRSATRNPGRGLGAEARVNALDSRLRGNDDNAVFSGSRPITKRDPVIAGKGSATRNPGRALGAEAEVGSLDFRGGGNDGRTLLRAFIITGKIKTVAVQHSNGLKKT